MKFKIGDKVIINSKGNYKGVIIDINEIIRPASGILCSANFTSRWEVRESKLNELGIWRSEQDAMDKVQFFYSKKDIEFYVSHLVIFNYCNEVIS